MKIVAVLLLVAVAIASAELSLVDKARPFLQGIEQLPVLLQKARNGGPSLREVLGRPDDVHLDVLEAKIRKDLGQTFRQFLEDLLKRLQELGEKAKDGLEELFEELFKKPPTTDSAAKFVLQVTALQNEQKHVGSVVGSALDSTSLAETLTSISARGISDWWESINEWLAGLGGLIPDSLTAFKDWVKGVFQKVIDASKPLREQVKDLAIEFLKNNWETLTVKLVKEALDFFTPFEGEIGADIMRKLIDLAKKFGLVPWDKNN